MRTITLKIALTDDNKIATVESCSGLPSNKVESHLLIIGILENLKQRHLDKLNNLYEKTYKNGEKDADI